MGLPKLNVTSHELTLPFAKQDIKYRAMTVGEEKILSIAKSSESTKEIIGAIKQVITNCTFGTVDPEKVALIDFEFLFLWIRIRSKGEVSELKMACLSESCKEMIDVDLDLTQYKMKNFTQDNRIPLEEGIGLVMKSPTLAIMNILTNKDITDYDQNLQVIQECIDYVYNGDELFHFKDATQQEIDEFMISIETYNMKKIKKYVDNLPTIFYEVEYKCKCGHNSARTIEGIDNFF